MISEQDRIEHVEKLLVSSYKSSFRRIVSSWNFPDYHFRNVFQSFENDTKTFNRFYNSAAKYLNNPQIWPAKFEIEKEFGAYLFANMVEKIVAPNRYNHLGILISSTKTFQIYRALFDEDQFPTIRNGFGIDAISGISVPDLLYLTQEENSPFSPKISATIEITTSPEKDKLDNKVYGFSKDVYRYPEIFRPNAFMLCVSPFDSPTDEGMFAREYFGFDPLPISMLHFKNFRNHLLYQKQVNGAALYDIYEGVKPKSLPSKTMTRIYQNPAAKRYLS